MLSFNHASRGDIFGEIATLDGQARTADATALTRVTTMMLSRASLMRLMEAKPILAHAAVAFLCRRLRATSEQIEAIALHSIEVRLARFLLAAIALRGQGEVGMQPIALDLGMSQTELGLLLGASRSKVNEALAALEKLGAVRRSEGHVECNLRALQDAGLRACALRTRSHRAGKAPKPPAVARTPPPDRSRPAAVARRCGRGATSWPCGARRRACARGRGGGLRRRSGRRR